MKMVFTFILVTLLSACAQLKDTFDFSSAEEQESAQNTSAANDTVSLTANGEPAMNIHQHITRLGNKLFSSSKSIELDQQVAVGTFLPINQIGGSELPVENVLGQQIQESFVTVGTQAGLRIVEFKTMPAIKFQDGYDLMLSRNIAELNASVDAKYYITGTFAEQTDSFVINARIIDLTNQSVVAAATDFIPTNVMTSQHKISMKNNLLYRRTY